MSRDYSRGLNTQPCGAPVLRMLWRIQSLGLGAFCEELLSPVPEPVEFVVSSIHVC